MMDGIMHLLYLYLYIYSLLVIYKPSGTLAAKVSINQNITGFVNVTDTHLTCSFLFEKGEQIFSVHIIAKTLTEDFDNKKPIAIFKPDEAAKIHTSAEYLLGRVTLTNITTTSTNASMTFRKLKCIDEKDYMCKLLFYDMGGDILTEKSQATRILVKAPPSRPDYISSIIMSSSKTEKHGNDSRKFIRNIYNSAFPKYPIDTTMSTLLQTTVKPTKFLREGDKVILTCTGNIGKPPGKLVWQKIYPQKNDKRSVIYYNGITVIEELPDTCSFRETINLTVLISAEDLNAQFRCFEESQDSPDMYIETSRLDVHFPVRDVHINNQPNQRQYDGKTHKIKLTCKASGNPEPKYAWFKEDNDKILISRTNLYVIEDVIRNNSGVYICEAYNTINSVYYTHSNSVEVNIADELVPKAEQESLNIFTVHAAYAIPVTCAVVVVVLCFTVNKGKCKREKRHVPAVNVIYSEVNEQTKLKYRLTKNQATPLQHNTIQHDTVDGAHEVSSNPTFKYNMITGNLEVYTHV